MVPSVRVRLFATAREAVGHREVSVPVAASGAAAADVLATLVGRYPRLAGVARGCRLVVNGRFVDGGNARVRPGDELALHPPYSGG